ncbi:hypothetical protein PUN28_002187 [Cardiocondyla obscurior]|uniref:Uncharacterized protein n=1 Tax=Cardiocondyla obscurior TaxID=286306 RepID=A0AAW2GT25_9HYME
MIDEEFNRMYKESSIFLEKFYTYFVPRIHTYCNTVRPDLYKIFAFIEDESLRAILILTHLLPVCNSIRKGKKKNKNLNYQFPNSALIQIWPEGSNINNKVECLKQDAQGPIQTYIILIKGQRPTHFVQADNNTITPNMNSSVVALDLLFKIFHVLNVTYPKNLINFFKFMQQYCFKVSLDKAHAFVATTHINICNIIP